MKKISVSRAFLVLMGAVFTVSTSAGAVTCETDVKWSCEIDLQGGGISAAFIEGGSFEGGPGQLKCDDGKDTETVAHIRYALIGYAPAAVGFAIHFGMTYRSQSFVVCDESLTNLLPRQKPEMGQLAPGDRAAQVTAGVRAQGVFLKQRVGSSAAVNASVSESQLDLDGAVDIAFQQYKGESLGLFVGAEIYGMLMWLAEDQPEDSWRQSLK